MRIYKCQNKECNEGCVIIIPIRPFPAFAFINCLKYSKSDKDFIPQWQLVVY